MRRLVHMVIEGPFPKHFIMKNFKRTAKLTVLQQNPHNHYLHSTINILLVLSLSFYPFINSSFKNVFQSKLFQQTYY